MTLTSGPTGRLPSALLESRIVIHIIQSQAHHTRKYVIAVVYERVTYPSSSPYQRGYPSTLTFLILHKHKHKHEQGVEIG